MKALKIFLSKNFGLVNGSFLEHKAEIPKTILSQFSKGNKNLTTMNQFKILKTLSRLEKDIQELREKMIEENPRYRIEIERNFPDIHLRFLRD